MKFHIVKSACGKQFILSFIWQRIISMPSVFHFLLSHFYTPRGNRLRLWSVTNFPVSSCSFFVALFARLCYMLCYIIPAIHTAFCFLKVIFICFFGVCRNEYVAWWFNLKLIDTAPLKQTSTQMSFLQNVFWSEKRRLCQPQRKLWGKRALTFCKWTRTQNDVSSWLVNVWSIANLYWSRLARISELFGASYTCDEAQTSLRALLSFLLGEHLSVTVLRVSHFPQLVFNNIPAKAKVRYEMIF